MQIDTIRRQLSRLNREIAGEMNQSAVDLSQQSGRGDADFLYIYGIVGGKDVGKTTLINQLAGAPISPDTDILDEGTRAAVAYCHGDDIVAVKERLGPPLQDRINFVTHDRRELQNVVLMDLPDYDSRFDSHLAEVKALVRYLQGLIWITTPRKYGDHTFLEQLVTVAQSHENYYIIVNKVDQIEPASSLETIRDEVVRFVSGECTKRQIQPPHPDRLFLLSAITPAKYEFGRMRDRLIRPHTAEEIARAKITNIRAEFRRNLKRINSAYQLDHHLDLIDRNLDFIQSRIGAVFGETYVQAVSERLAARQDSYRRISKVVFSQRVKQWPVLRTVFYPLTVIISALGGRLGFDPKKDPTEGEASGLGLLRGNGLSAVHQLFQIRDEMQAAFPDLNEAMGPEPDFPKAVETHINALLTAYEERVTEDLMRTTARPGTIKRFFVYMPLVWFPFLQPLILKLNAVNWLEAPTLANLKEVAVFFVSLLGSGALLTSFAFLGLFYGVLMMVMYTRVVREVQKQGQQRFQDLWYERFLSELAETLAQPIVNRQISLKAKRSRLAEIEKGLEGAVDRLEAGSSPSDGKSDSG